MISSRLQSGKGAIPIESAPDSIASMEFALAEGNQAYLRQHMPDLQDLLDRIQKRTSELALLQFRGCCVRDESGLPVGNYPFCR